MENAAGNVMIEYFSDLGGKNEGAYDTAGKERSSRQKSI